MTPVDESLFRDFKGDIRSVDFLLEEKREVLLDSLPGMPEDVAAKKIRRGVYLTTFNAMEECLKNVSFHVCKVINECEISTGGISDSVKGAIYRGLSDGIGSTPSWIKGPEKIAREVRFASAIRGFYTDSVVRIEGDQFFSNSNISADQFEAFPKLLKRLYDSLLKREYPGRTISTRHFSSFFGKVGELLDPDCIDASRGPEVKSSNMASVMYSSVENIRNRSAHSAGFSPSIDQIYSLRRQTVMICTSYFLYCVAVGEFIRDLSAGKADFDQIASAVVSFNSPSLLCGSLPTVSSSLGVF
ncbi:hypothetical protein [Corynebacterium variabile]|uniref:hypothetical protein n=1 Tax=Corynebacterium variabile TaxID=1727 RepID=UPI003F9B6956